MRSLSPKLCRELVEQMPAEFIKFHLLRLLTWQMEKGNLHTNRFGWFVSLMAHHHQKLLHEHMEKTPAQMHGEPQDLASLMAEYIEG